jgi:hypothetical protein
MNGQGQLGRYGKMVSDYVDFTKDGVPPGAPTQAPDINLGFLVQQQGNETVFKLQALYIITPTRPKDSYLPTDIIKVVLTNGHKSKTVIDPTWISHVVKLIDTLQMTTAGITSGSTVASGTIETIHAEFYEKSGAVIPVKFTFPFGDVFSGQQ